MLDRLRGRPFYTWDHSRHKEAGRVYKGSCCFNHIIGSPTKDGIEKPIFDYERLLYESLLLPGFLNSYPLGMTDPYFKNRIKMLIKKLKLFQVYDVVLIFLLYYLP